MGLTHKDSVRFDVIAEGGARILLALTRYASRVSFPVILTCGTEDHEATDPHTLGEAYDVSVKPFPNTPAILAARTFLQSELGPLFTVLFECPHKPDDPLLQTIAYLNPGATAPHFHIQVKKGYSYPPPSMRA